MPLRSGAVRDIVLLLAAFGLLLGGLFLYSGVWPPAVIVESGSMMHPDHEVTYGRIGTIDPGDLVLVKFTPSIDDIVTFVEGGGGTYGRSGDVIVYFPANNREGTPIIHRAIAYVERLVVDGQTEYRMRWTPGTTCPAGATSVEDGRWCAWGSEGITISYPGVFQLSSYQPIRTGFLTKGDNQQSNPTVDQLMIDIADDEQGRPSPVPLSWVAGKARGELPWLGLIKLSLGSDYNQRGCGSAPPRFHLWDESATCNGWYAIGRAYAPTDLWAMLGLTLFVLVGLPLGFDVWRSQRARAAASEAVAAAPRSPEHEAAAREARVALMAERESVPRLVVLSVLSLGVYLGLWWMRRIPALERVSPRERFDVTWAWAIVIGDALLLGSVIAGITGASRPQLPPLFEAALSLLVFAAILPIPVYLSLKARRALEDGLGARLSPLWTVVLPGWYVQHKINELASDES